METNEMYVLLKVSAEYIEKLTAEKMLIEKKIAAFNAVIDTIASNLQKGDKVEK